MELIKDHGKFSEAKTVFISNAKEAWKHATTLAVSAVQHYVDSSFKDPSWIAELQEAFLESGGTFSMCFEKMIQSVTNVKFRQNTDDLDQAVTCKSKGNMPEGWVDILDTVGKEGLNRYDTGGKKTKRRAATWNDDWARKPRTTQSSDADVTNLKTTELGNKLVDAVKDTDSLSDEQKAAAQKATEDFAKALEAIKSGELPEVPGTPETETTETPESQEEGGIYPSVHHFMTAEQQEKMDEMFVKMEKIAKAKGAKSLDGIFKSMDNQLNQAIKALDKAVSNLAKAG